MPLVCRRKMATASLNASPRELGDGIIYFFIVGANTLSTMQGVINSVAPPEGWFSTLVKHSFRDAGRAVTEAHSPNHPPKRTPGGQAASWMRLLSAAELPTTLHNNSRRH